MASISELTHLISIFRGDAGQGGLKGLVPPPYAGAAHDGAFLAATGLWTVPQPASAGITVGTTILSGGTPGYILYDSSGVVGELAVTGAGNVVLANGPTLTAPVLGVASATSLKLNSNVTLFGDAADTLALRDGVNPQTLLLYNTFTDGTHFEAATFDWSTVANVLTIGTIKGSVGGSVRNFQIVIGGVNHLDYGVSTGSQWTMTGILNTSSTLNVSASITLGGNITFGQGGKSVIRNDTDGIFLFENNAQNGFTSLQLHTDLSLTRAAAATLQLGAPDVDTAPVAQALRTQGALTGGTNNVSGVDFTLSVSPGKGTGPGGKFIVQTAPAGASGNTPNAFATGLTITAPAVNMQPSCVLGNQALATTATDGFLYFASGAGTPTGTPTAFTGRVPVYIDTTNSQLWLYLGGAWKQPKTPAAAALVTWQ